jgi:hypothetical protein
LAANPREALARLGFQPAADDSIPTGIWNCMSVSKLASKDAIRAGLYSLRAQLTARQATFNPISLGIRVASEKVAA